jgi:outer membrane protein assembly factor BamA
MPSYFFKKTLALLLFIGGGCVSFSQENNIGNDFVVVSEFKIIGNKTTKGNIIEREIPLVIGDTVLTSELNGALERIQSNLINTSLFNFVTVEPVYFNEEKISLYITVEERWYWWPIPIFQIEETNINSWWEEKDFNKVSYGMFLAKENFRGRKEKVMLLLQTGYSEKIGVKYVIPFVNKKKTSGLGFNFEFARNHEVFHSVISNKRVYYRSENGYIQRELATEINYELRPKLYFKHNFALGYKAVNVSDAIINNNPSFIAGNKNGMEFFTLSYKVKRDKRDNKNYPVKGSYYDFSVSNSGFGILDKDLNSFFATTHLKKFWELAPKIYFSGSVKMKYTFQEAPFYLLKGLGEGNDLVRGYELYVINGEHFGVIKSQLKYGLLENKTFKMKALKANGFNKIPLSIYLGSYFDLGYVASKKGSTFGFLENELIYGGGFSLDFVSYYDMVLRTEFSINRMNEKGLFIHFIASI